MVRERQRQIGEGPSKPDPVDHEWDEAVFWSRRAAWYARRHPGKDARGEAIKVMKRRGYNTETAEYFIDGPGIDEILYPKET